VLGWFGTNWETVWTSVKSFFEGVWNGIKTFFSNILTAINTTASTVWNGIKTFFSTTLTSIKSTFSTAWEGIKTTVSNIGTSIKTNVTTTWNNLKTSLSTTMTNIKSAASTAWEGMKTSIGTIVDGIKTKVSGVFDGIKSTASTVWGNIKTAMTSPVETAKTTISNAIERIKGLFNFTWSFPSLKMPHFSWYWQDIGGIVSIPMISVSWYKKAMDGGMILNNPTIFGMQNGQLLGAGEAGSETVVGTRSLMDMIRQAVSSVEQAMNIYYGGVTINVYSQPGQDISELADEIEERINMNVARRAAAFS